MEESVNKVRTGVKLLAKEVLAIREGLSKSEVDGVEDRGEEMANLTLCYRHLEDASMRLGKVLQAKDGGKSVYDKETTVGA